MNASPQNFTQRREKKVIPTGGNPVPFVVNADYIHVAELSGPLEWQVNGGNDSDVKLGATLQGTPGRGDQRTISFINRSGSPVTVKILFGMGTYLVTGSVTIQNASLAIDAGTVASITPPSVTLTPAMGSLTAVGSVPAGSRFVSLHVVAGPVTILGVSRDTGYTVDFPAQGRFDVIGAISYNATGGQIDYLTLTPP